MVIPNICSNAFDIAGIVEGSVMGRRQLALYIDSNLHLADPRARSVRRLVLRRELTHRALAAQAPAYIWPHALGRISALFEHPGGDELHIAVPEGSWRVAAFELQYHLWRAVEKSAPELVITGSEADHQRHADAWVARAAKAIRTALAAGSIAASNRHRDDIGITLCFHGELNLRHASVRGADARHQVYQRCAELLGYSTVRGLPGAVARIADPVARDLAFWQVGQTALMNALARGDEGAEQLAALYRDHGSAWTEHRDPLLDFGVSSCDRGLLVATSFTAGELAARLAHGLRQHVPVREIIITGSCGSLAPEPTDCEIVLGTSASLMGEPALSLAPWPEYSLPAWIEERVHRRIGAIVTVSTPAVETHAALGSAAAQGAIAVECELAHLVAAVPEVVPVRAIFGAVDRPLAGITPAEPSNDLTPLWACAEWMAAYLWPYSSPDR